MSKYGIENLKLAFTFMFSTAKGIESALADGFQPLSDVPAIAYSARGIVEVIKLRKTIAVELGNVDPEERAELVTWAENEFDLSNEAVEVLIEDLFAWIDATVQVIDDVRDL